MKNVAMLIITGMPIMATVFVGAILASSVVSADDVVDEINITVPVSCTMSGAGMTSHNANITNGTYQANIGTTTLHAFCNDSEGFAIYAAGYTGNKIGDTNSNKLVGVSTNATIETGLATAAGNPDVSNWAMKLAITQDSGDTTGTNAYTIDSAPNTSGGADAAFSQYHIVPNEYTKVAHKNSGTDMTAVTGGVKLTTTYGIYISKTQPADTYSGRVIYTLVHPSSADIPVHPDQIGVNYHGNNLTFSDEAIENKVVYGPSCTSMYIATTPVVVETSNLTNGVQNGGYTDSESVLLNRTFTGASKVKVVVDYSITFDTATLVAIGDTWDGNWINYDYDEWGNDFIDSYDSISGTKTYIFNSDTVTVYIESLGVPESGYDYGFYARVYPIYTTEQSGTEETSICSLVTQMGTYAQTTTWNGKWYMVAEDQLIWFENEAAVLDYIETNESTLAGVVIDAYAYNPYFINYNGNGATAGTMNGFYTTLDTDTAYSTADLMAHNFKKIGYGFAGWSADPNATVNGNSKIYGPNEKIEGDELTFDNNRTATLYAVWVPSAGNLQSWSGCSSMAIGQVTALTDIRDNNVYAVGKLADGNCWMMENLRLDAANSTDSAKAQGFGGVFTGLANSEDTNFSDSTTANNKYSTSNITGNYQGYRFPRYNNNNINIGGTNSASVILEITPGCWHIDCSESKSDHAQWYSYGNYYTWAAAMANTENLSSASSSESVSTSICPVGWALPYGRNTGNGAISGGFSYLDTQLGGTGNEQYGDTGRWRSFPNNFVYSGTWRVANAHSRGLDGYYWSRTADKYNYSFSMIISNYRIEPGTNKGWVSGKSYGLSVRCLTSGIQVELTQNR